MWHQLTGYDPKIELDTLNKDKMVQLMNWYIKTIIVIAPL